MTRAQRLLLPIVAVVALVGVGIGIFSIVSAPQTTTLRHAVTTLQIQLKSANAQIATDHGQIVTDHGQIAALQSSLVHTASQGNVAQLQGNVGRLQTQMGTLLICIPQLQQEIGGLNVNTSNTAGYLTSAFLSNSTIISSNCTKLLTGS